MYENNDNYGGNMLIINDIHVACSRVAGTTPATQSALRQYVRDNLETLLRHGDREVTVNGDLLDGFAVDSHELVKVFDIFSKWLEGNSGRHLNLVGGNHDFSAKGDRLSSFHMLGHFLREVHPGKVVIYDKGLRWINDNIYCIPHQLNQECFDLEVDKAAFPVEPDILMTSPRDTSGPKYLLLHANYKNSFAESSDHSLNLSDEQVGNLMRAGWTLVIGHEHVGYTLRGERVIVTGNQFPTSVSDCIGDEIKHCLRIENGKHEFIETWRAEGDYLEVDWQALRDGTAEIADQRFVRIVGDATAEQAADVVNVVARFRQNAENVLVAGNAVKVAGQAVFDDLALESTESIRAFDVLGAIYSQLEPKEIEIVKELLG